MLTPEQIAHGQLGSRTRERGPVADALSHGCGAEESGTVTRWPRTPTPRSGFRCGHLILGDWRPEPTTAFRCERCGAGAYRPATPEETVMCDPCLRAGGH